MLVRGGPDLKAHGLSERIQRVQGDVLALPFPDATFDCATIGFGLRNLADIPLGLREFRRTRSSPADGWRCWTSCAPAGAVGRAAYGVGFRRLMRWVGWALSGDRSAYRYLPESVERYLAPDELASKPCGRRASPDVGYRGLMLGTIRHPLGSGGVEGVSSNLLPRAESSS